MQFDIDQNDLDDGDQTDTLGTIKSPHKHDWFDDKKPKDKAML